MLVKFDSDIDYSAWVSEKESYILSALCLMVQDKPELEEDTSFQTAFDYALLLYAVMNGNGEFGVNVEKIHCPVVSDVLLQFGRSGFDFLEDLVHNTVHSKIMQDAFPIESDDANRQIMDEIIENEDKSKAEITELIAQNLNDVFAGEKSMAWRNGIAEDLEKVHQGEAAWEWFVEKHRNDRNPEPIFSDDKLKMMWNQFSDSYKFGDRWEN